MKPYNEWLLQARRYDKSVDFGSPMTAWTDAMRAEWRAARAEGRRPDMKNVPRRA
ncbi:MAG TPA: hypothetical protein PKZ27_02865 [Rhodocyclaceae bacterium]|nr:hypothetical protein [Burkholderiaceae bacterium]HRP74507.1 hypothetical protein [Rhodocyclaceae bacterium]